MMPGGLQVAERCYSCGTTPSVIDPPDFPGPTNLILSGGASFGGGRAKVLTEFLHNLYCTTVKTHVFCVKGWDANFSIPIDITAPMTSTVGGSYSAGVRYKIYSSGSYGFSIGNFQSTSIFETVPSGGTFTTGDQYFSTFETSRQYSYAPPGGSPSFITGATFAWLAVAQRDIYGLRIRRKSGTDTWYLSCQAGVVTIENGDGTKSFSSSGTLQSLASAINASSIGSEIEARATVAWTNTGESSTPVTQEWRTIVRREDPSTILKSIPKTRLNVACATPNPPTGSYSTSGGFPVYERGEILRPRGIVYGIGNPFLNPLTSTPSFINDIGSDLSKGTYSNDESGALSFVQTPAVLKSPGAVSNGPWGIWGIGDEFPGAPLGFNPGFFSALYPFESGSAPVKGTRLGDGTPLSKSVVTVTDNGCNGPNDVLACANETINTITQFSVGNSAYCCNSCGDESPCYFESGVPPFVSPCDPIPGPELNLDFCCNFGDCVCGGVAMSTAQPISGTVFDCGASQSCGALFPCPECNVYFYLTTFQEVASGTIACSVTSTFSADFSWRIG